MKIKHYISALLLVLLLGACQDDGQIDFAFLQVNDVYEIAPIQGGEVGGMARVETLHQQLLQENPNTLLLMAGDFLNPSLMGSLRYQGHPVKGKQMIEVMNAMKFDLAAFGNHEFDLKQNELQDRIDSSNFSWISANVFHQIGDSIQPFVQHKNGVAHPIGGSHIRELSDEDGTKIKIAFVSVCIPSNPKPYVHYTDMFAEIQSEYQRVKDSVDIVFGLTHVKISQDKRIAELLPDIPLIMGGHEHDHMNVAVGNTAITKADANAKSAYIHRIHHDTKTGKTTLSSTLQQIDKSIAGDAKIEQIVSKWQEVLDKLMSEVVDNPNEIIFFAKQALDGRDKPIRSEQTNLGRLIARSMAFSFDDKVDCAIVNGGSIRLDDQLVGDITSVDVFRALPYGGPVYKVTMTGSLLKRVLNYGERAKGKGAYLQRYNLEQQNDTWLLGGKKIIDYKKYTVVVTDYLMRGFDIPFLTEKTKRVLGVEKPQNKTELASDIRKGVIAYMKHLQ